MTTQKLSNWLKSISASRPEIPLQNDLKTYVHPCVIDQQETIVYPKGLNESEPQLFQQLFHYYSQQGYQLKEDQREYKKVSTPHKSRRSWVPVFVFTAGLLFESSAQADFEITLDKASEAEHQQIELQLISNHSVLSEIRQNLDLTPCFEKITHKDLKQRTAQVLYEILTDRYQTDISDPKHIKKDLEQIANYYSSHPEVVSLFNAIKDHNWQLKFDADNWTTVASGNMFDVGSAEVHFNTRSAAQLRLNDSCRDNPVCIASPADALLHELLHVHSMFNSTEKFISQGGMNNLLYPYQHEHDIIQQERQLYHLMSQHDGIKRPSRHSHAGRIVKANCSTCIK